jgi:hypothetical protein
VGRLTDWQTWALAYPLWLAATVWLCDAGAPPWRRRLPGPPAGAGDAADAEAILHSTRARLRPHDAEESMHGTWQ